MWFGLFLKADGMDGAGVKSKAKLRQNYIIIVAFVKLMKYETNKVKYMVLMMMTMDAYMSKTMDDGALSTSPSF